MLSGVFVGNAPPDIGRTPKIQAAPPAPRPPSPTTSAIAYSQATKTSRFSIDSIPASASSPPVGELVNRVQNLVFLRSSRGLGDFLGSAGGQGPVLCNYNSIHKMEPDSFAVFMNIMKR